MMQRLTRSYVPSQFRNPWRLAFRLLRSGSPEARFAMELALAGLAAAPMDMLLAQFEKRRYRRASPPSLPVVFVVGAARSGTTLVAQTLIRALPVAYLSNITTVFPRSPLTATAVLRVKPRNHAIEASSFYGKTRHLWGPNDALHIWDRWFGPDRTVAPTSLTQAQADSMRQFFGALQALFGRPVLNKHNSLNASAHLVADVLDTAHFICVVREPTYQAQSLLRARREIHGDASVPYGLDDPLAPDGHAPIEAVCLQALHHERLAAIQHRRIGAERFWTVRYGDFCADPNSLVRRVARDILALDPTAIASLPQSARYTSGDVAKLPPDEFHELQVTMTRLRHESDKVAAG